MRLFIAIPLPSSLAVRASQLIPEGLPGLRRVPPENLHVTLAFLGYTPDERLPDATSAASVGAAEVGPFRLAFEGAGRFPERGRPRVLWLAITEGRESHLEDEEGRAAAIQAAASEALATGRFYRPERRPWWPHLTLARVPDAVGLTEARAVAAAVEQLQPPKLATDVREIVVMQSVLSRSGPTYTALSHAALRGSSPPGDFRALNSEFTEGSFE